MNLMLVRTKQQHFSVLWEPFATSTPLKPVTKDGKPENGPQNKPSVDSLFPEKPPKRCNVLNVKHSESKHLPSKKVRKNRSCAHFDLTSSSSSDDDASDVKNRPVIKLSSKTRTRSLLGNKNDSRSVGSNDKPNGDVQIVLDSSGERILDESNKRCLEEKEKAGMPTNPPKNTEQVVSVNETRKKQVKVKVSVNKDGSRCQKTIAKVKNTKVLKVVKRKAPTVKDKQSETPSLDSKPNLSHQLFSESREQEFINTLDLTSAEITEPVPTNRHSLILKNTQNKQTPPCKDTSNECERPKRTKQKPKEFWLPNTSPDSTGTGQMKQKQKPKVSKQKAVVSQNAEETKENNPESAVVGKPRRKTRNAQKTKSVIVDVSEDERKNTQAVVWSGVCESDARKHTEAVVEEVAAGTTVFKPLSELSFKENDTGCSVVQCHSINNLKCGVFKLKTKSQLNCKTQHRNSHLGGVVVKGSLHMKIGSKELDMKEGDMAFVPPLTKWQATNTGESEAVFYYWCARFK